MFRPHSPSAVEAPRYVLMGAVFFSVLAVICAVAAIAIRTKISSLAVFLGAVAAIGVILAIITTWVGGSRLLEVRLAMRFGFDDPHQYWQDRSSRGWTVEQMSAEVHRDPDWLRRANDRWARINQRASRSG